MPNAEYYITERKTEERKWFDIGTISLLPHEPKELTDKDDNFIPHWAKYNPQNRTVKVTIQEVL